MSELLIIPLRFLETETQAKLVQDQADRLGLSVSAYLRSIVRQYTDPDGETIRRLVDPPVVYDTRGDE